MDPEDLREELQRQFDASERAVRVVTRQACDLADSGRIENDLGSPLTVTALCTHLADAPDEYTLVQRWNWWLGSLEFAFGGYLEFLIRTDIE